jgi:sugar lactone lactonase YvrE
LRLPDVVIPTSQLPETVAAAPSAPRPRLAVAGAFGGAIEVFDLDGTLLARYEVGGRPVRLALTGDGARIAASLSAAGTVAVIEDGGVVRMLATGGTPDGLAFVAGGRLLVVGDLLSGRVQIWDIEGSRLLWSLDAGESAGAILLRLR